MNQESLRIGEVAAQSGVNVQTLRYYERRGLLEEPERRPSGYRTYLMRSAWSVLSRRPRSWVSR